jgi:dihydropteroate synthase
MGIVNVTPDSFSDGGQHFSTQAAVNHALQLIEQGADLLDIGGESTRPGATPVSVEEELNRILPVVRDLATQTTIPLSVDTSKSEVARQCLAAGAHVMNDVTALTGDPAMAAVVREFNAGAILMHMQGTPRTMQIAPRYNDVVAEIGRYFEQRLQELADLGIGAERLALDPGIGFGKTRDHNLELLARLTEFRRFGRPLCLGVSRKGFLGKLLNRDVSRRLASSLAVACHATLRGSAQIVRVHDVEETRDALTTIAAIEEFSGRS